MDGRGAKVVRALLDGIVCVFFFLGLFCFSGVVGERGGGSGSGFWVLVWFRFRGRRLCVCIPFIATYLLLQLATSTSLSHILTLTLPLSPSSSLSPCFSHSLLSTLCSHIRFVLEWLRGRARGEEREERQWDGGYGITPGLNWTGLDRNRKYILGRHASVLRASGKS